MRDDKNVLGGRLEPCSVSPRTGFYRDGCCNTGPDDLGMHVVCVQMTQRFLDFSREHGNDLSTPVPEHDFPGLVRAIAGASASPAGGRHSRRERPRRWS